MSWESSQGASGVADNRGRFLPQIKAETSVFVATNATTDLGYRHDGIEIIVDKDTVPRRSNSAGNAVRA